MSSLVQCNRVVLSGDLHLWLAVDAAALSCPSPGSANPVNTVAAAPTAAVEGFIKR